MFEQILVAVDGSEHSKRALATAGELGKLSNGRITLLHVVPAHTGTRVPRHLKAFDKIEHSCRTQEDVLRSAAEEILQAGSDSLAESGAEIETRVVSGHPAQAIVEQAQSLDASVIVIGTHGLSDLKGLLLGSVSYRVAQTAPCPVLLVR